MFDNHLINHRNAALGQKHNISAASDKSLTAGTRVADRFADNMSMRQRGGGERRGEETAQDTDSIQQSITVHACE